MRISVVIPVYNASSTIEKCIASAVSELEHNNCEYEVIAVDDGSVDSSLKTLTKLADDNPNIKVISQTNGGPSKARNRGMKEASGEYIALLDSDDIWVPGRLKAQLDYLAENPDVAMLTGYNSIAGGEVTPFLIDFKKEAFHNYFSPSCSIFKKIVAESYSFDETMKYSEDMRFFIDVMQDYRCAFIPVVCAANADGRQNFTASGLSSHLWEMERGELSNFNYMWRKKNIGLMTMMAACSYSFLKYLRRCLISHAR